MSTQAYAVIIGGGAAGIACACKTAHLNPQKKIVLLEKADRVGRKIMISGNGRCNLTNTSATEKSYHGEGAQELVNILFKKYSADRVQEEFRALGCEVTVCTEDGSRGEHALVTDLLPGMNPSYFYACGPEGMLRALERGTDCGGEFSLEARMGCGFGACMGCTRETVGGPKRVCRDGPVFRKGELLW